jgi:hypothetical protein
MQPSTTSACNDTIMSGPWTFPNWSNTQTPYDNILGSVSVSVPHTASPNAFGFSDRIEVINPMNLDTNQRMTISPRLVLTTIRIIAF